jgi:pimeloyl-ACP methyl ester carboxylesterase
MTIDPLLLIHAFPMDASMWEPQLEAFPTPVIAPNLPGFGGQPAAGDVMSMGAAAERCVEVLATAGIKRAVVCGLSMGGYVALELWRRHPEMISGLVLANTRAEADDEAGRERRRALAERLRTEGNGFMVENPPPLLSETAPPELRALVKEIIAAQPADAIAAASLGMAERADSRADLGRIDVPTLVVTSSADGLIPADVTKEMAPEIEGATLTVIEGAGHLSNLEAPRAFNEAIGEHLERCEASPG